MKTLRTIQTLSKVGKILCKIIFIFSLIGGIGCILGIVGMAGIPQGFKIGGVTIQNMIETSAEISIGSYYAAMGAGIVLCSGEAVICKIAEQYFKKELEAGTPFTLDGAKRMLRLGIYTICIPIGTTALSAMIYEIMKHVFNDVADKDFSNSVSVGLGIMFIITGLLCRCGAELMGEKEEKQ